MLKFIYILGYPFPMYAIMAFFGVVFALIIALFKRKAFSLRRRDAFRIVAFALAGALIGARIFAAIGQIVRHGGDPGFWTAANWLRILGPGGVFYGGLLGALGAATLSAKIGHVKLAKVLDIGAYIGLASQSINRIGCYCAGCCYGITLSHGTQLPVQLFESGFCFAVLVAFLIVRPERRWPGLPLFPVFLTIYSVGRFMLEFLRGDASRGVWILSTSQWIALVLITISVIWIKKSGFSFRSNKSKKQKAQEVVRL